MPTYDYVCEACGHEFEHFQSMSDRRRSKGPKCGKKRLVRKVGGGGGVIFKGSGFYETDYKRASQTAPSAEPKKKDGESTKSTASDAPAAGGSGGGGAPASQAAPGTC